VLLRSTVGSNPTRSAIEKTIKGIMDNFSVQMYHEHNKKAHEILGIPYKLDAIIPLDMALDRIAILVKQQKKGLATLQKKSQRG
jgi:hypothetical protein